MYKTEQEEFWAGDFGDKYISRNSENTYLSSNIYSFSRILQHTDKINSVIEFGANIGLNLQALKILNPNLLMSAIEINKKASRILETQGVSVYNQSILEYKPLTQFDLVLIKGVLIHINPNELDSVYERLYKSTNKYLCISEYYSQTPVTIDYRGNSNKLFKRDFAGEILDKYTDLKLIDYGFEYHRDTHNPQDDMNWFLIEKRK